MEIERDWFVDQLCSTVVNFSERVESLEPHRFFLEPKYRSMESEVVKKKNDFNGQIITGLLLFLSTSINSVLGTVHTELRRIVKNVDAQSSLEQATGRK